MQNLVNPEASAAYIDYVIEHANAVLSTPLTRDDVIGTWAGLRPLLQPGTKDGTSSAKVSREHTVVEATPGLVTIAGGKLTTYRRLAEQVTDSVCAALRVVGHPWTARTPLPGGDLPGADLEKFRTRMARRYAWLDRPLLERYARAYGTRMERLLVGCRRMADLGQAVLPGLTEREIAYLRREEFALTAEDILFRRTKLGVHLPTGSVARLERWLTTHDTVTP